jgi:hypothetical protein
VTTKFERERSDVETLLSLLSISGPILTDPNAGGQNESGADVVYAAPSGVVGIQVTDYAVDEAEEQRPKKQSRGVEKRLAADAMNDGGPVKGYGMTGSANYIRALKARIMNKLPKSMAAFPKKWLLIVAQKEAWGTALSTFFAAEHVDLNEMNRVINCDLQGSQYNRVLVLLQSEKVVIEWTPTGHWKFLVDDRKPLSQARVQKLQEKLQPGK